jgi:hypothetical protein
MTGDFPDHRAVAAAQITEVGRLAGLWRYPVKSMAAEPLEHATSASRASPATAAGRSCAPVWSAATSPG